MNTTLIGAGSTVLVAVLALLGVWLTTRGTRKVAEEQREVDDGQLAVAKRAQLAEAEAQLRTQTALEHQQLVTNLSDQYDRLVQRIGAMEAREEEQRERVHHLEVENGDLRHHAVDCTRKTDELARRIDDYARRYGVAVRYVRALHDWMSEHLPGDLKPPSPPEGLAFDLEDPMHASDDPPPLGWPPRGPGPGRTVGP